MTQPSGQPGSGIRAGDNVMLRGSHPPKTGKVIGLLDRSADFLPPESESGQIPDVLASVQWKGKTKGVPERLDDLVKLP
jgi:hypothetical protein